MWKNRIVECWQAGQCSRLYFFENEKFRKFYNAAYSLPVSRFIMSWIYLQSTNDLDFIISYILDTISIVLFTPVIRFIM